MRKQLTAAVTTAVLMMGIATAQAVPPPVNPYLGPVGTATMHGDGESSDTTPNPGPGPSPTSVRFVELGAACPTILAGADGLPQALCTAIIGRTPTVMLLNPANGEPLAKLPLSSGGLLGGVYAFLDNHDRMVTADSSGNLLWVGHSRAANGSWQLFVDHTAPTASVVAAGDSFSSATPDQAGRIWFVTEHATVGVYDPATSHIASVTLPAGELVENSISSSPGGVAVATDHALYLLNADSAGSPHIAWRQQYDRGPSRKPGQLSWGTGSTPVFFGPTTGADYLTITDNAVPAEHLLVYRAGTGQQICNIDAKIVGTENAPVGFDNSVIVASTYGYPYPAGTIGPSQPASAPIAGGVTRVDLDATGCHIAWTNPLRSAAVPRLSLAEGKVYTFARCPLLLGRSTPADPFQYAVLDATTGHLDATRMIGIGLPVDTLQMVGSIVPGRIQYQGTVSGLFRIAG